MCKVALWALYTWASLDAFPQIDHLDLKRELCMTSYFHSAEWFIMCEHDPICPEHSWSHYMMKGFGIILFFRDIDGLDEEWHIINEHI